MDREKAIKGLECCTANPTQCDICPYYLVHPGVPYCKKMKQDALALLKKQEAVIITTDYFDGFNNRISHCPSCNSRLEWHQNKNYCGECGRSVKWE